MSRPHSQSQPGRSSGSHAHRSFWLLFAVAVLATGALTSAAAATPSPLTGLRVAASGLILLGSLSFAARVMIALDRDRRRAGAELRAGLRGGGGPARLSRKQIEVEE